MVKPGRGLLAALLAIVVSVIPAAAEYPEKPIKIVVGYGAGGSVDAVSRILAERLSQRLGQQVVVENMPGGGTVVATQALAGAQPDGYTLMMADIALGAKPALMKDLPYDTLKDFQTIVEVAALPSVLAVRKDTKAENLSQLVDLAKASPGDLNYGSAGIGSMMFLASELFKAQTKTDIVHIPYASAAEGTVALIAGDIDILIAAAPAMLPQKDKLRFLAVSNKERLDTLPDVPTFKEAGLADFDVQNWQGLIAPKGVPAEVVARINKETNAVLQESDVRERLGKMGMVVTGGTPEEFRDFLAAEYEKWSGLITSDMLSGG